MGFERILDERVAQRSNKKPNDKNVTPNTDTMGFTPLGFPFGEVLTWNEPIVVCAGMAEGYRIHEATGYAVACCVGEANIPKVAKQLNALMPYAPLMVAVDNDRAGQLAAHRSGFDYCMSFTQKDFSDVYQHGGGKGAVTYAMVPFPALAHADREREINRLMGRTADDYQPPRNELVLGNAETLGGLGYVGSLTISKPHLITGYDQYKKLALSMDCFIEQKDGIDHWLLMHSDQLALLLSMLDTGLRSSLKEIPLYLHVLESSFFEAINEGAFDDYPIPGGPPAMVKHGQDKRGACLVVNADYDEDIAMICSKAKGFFDKKANEWRLSIGTPEQKARVIHALAENPLRQFMFESPNEYGDWQVATPWTRDRFAAFVENGPAPAWDKQRFAANVASMESSVLVEPSGP
jgi:hypothetical protein